MGFTKRIIQRIHSLWEKVTDKPIYKEKLEKKDKVLNASPGAYGLVRGLKYRQSADFGADTFAPKIEVAWECSVDIERIDFGAGDYGLRVTLPSSAYVLARGVHAQDQFKVLELSSARANQKFEFVSEANVGDVDAGKIRIVSSTVWRLPDNSVIVPATAATGSITLDSAFTGADLVDGDIITLDDGTNPATTFEFDDGLGGGVGLGNVAVLFAPADTASDIRDALIAAINGVGLLDIAASPGTGLNPNVQLVNGTTGVAGNVAIIEVVTDPDLTVAGMAGGAAAYNAWIDELGDMIRVEIGAGVRK
jgi:hypothetical protein